MTLTKLSLKSNYSEIAVYVIVWLFIMAEPIFISTRLSLKISDHFPSLWLRYLPILILFIINAIWLVPKLLFRKKTLWYLGSVIILSILFVFLGECIFGPHFSGSHRLVISGPNNFAYFDGSITRLPAPGKPAPGIPLPHMEKFLKHPGILSPGFFNQIILCILIIGLNTGIKVTTKWFKDEQTRREIEKEYIKSELTFLQNQVSPHFFMNTLNNIHALIDIKAKDAQLAIVRLSKMMRYLLYESDQGNTTLDREIEFLESYIDLMKLRIDDTIHIKISIPKNYKNITLPPMLLIPFIENAFKHGVSYRQDSFIDISIEQSDESLMFTCSNSIPANKITDAKKEGVGLKNIKKRLELLYGNTCKLTIENNDTKFHVELILPIHDN